MHVFLWTINNTIFKPIFPSWNNSCLMEQDRKQFLHSSWNIEKRKRNQRKLSPCWRIQHELDRKQWNNLLTGDATRALIVSSPCLLLFPGMPRMCCDTNKFKFACLVCTICRFDSWSSCSLFVHNLENRTSLCLFRRHPRKKKPCVPHRGVATTITEQ